MVTDTLVSVGIIFIGVFAGVGMVRLDNWMGVRQQRKFNREIDEIVRKRESDV